MSATTYTFTPENSYILNRLGANNGIAELDSSGKVPASQLPSYVDDVVEAHTYDDFPITGESGKIYVDLSTNKTYRWGGSSYIEVSESLALGETESTAYRGDRGKIAYDHAQAKGSNFSLDLYKIETNSEGHVTRTERVQNATTSTPGLMSAEDKTKLDFLNGGVEAYSSFDLFPATGESEKMYIDTSESVIYYWNGSEYIAISSARQTVFADIPFSIGVNDWVQGNEVYTYSVTNTVIIPQSKFFVIFDKTAKNLTSGAEIDLDISGSQPAIVFTVTNLPLDTVSGRIYCVNYDAERIPVQVIDGAVPIAAGGTGSSSAIGARTNLGLGNAAVASIANNLTTDESGSVLDAYQGKILNNSKMNKVSSATNGDFAAFDSNGNVIDSGKNTNSFIASPVNIPEGKILKTGSNGNAVWSDLVDQSLTVSGAAADAKKTGDQLSDLKSAIDEISKKVIDASGATAGQVPVADGQGSWAWGNVSGDAMILGPEEIQKLVADGKAKSAFNIGDVIYIPWTDYTPSTPVVYQFPFVVVHVGDVYDQNDVLHHDALWLMAMYAEPEEIVFDAAEDTTVDLSTEPNALEGWYYWGLTGTNQYTELNLSTGDAIPTTYDSVHKCAINNLSVLRYGYNRWRDSAYRQWLNSDAAKNDNWWTSQHEGDIAPTNTYTNKPGWLYGFENRWLDVIKPVKVQTACNTVTDGGVTDVTYDRFFLPSLEQMYGKPQAAGVEGDYWEYWKEETGLDTPSNGSSSDSNEARKIPSVVNYPRGSAVSCRLRSAYRGNGYYVWSVSTGGYLIYSFASFAYRALPACVIY